MTQARQVAGPAAGSAWQPVIVAPPEHSARLLLPALPTAPFWARRRTSTFLGACGSVSADTVETAELLVSELVTNAARFAGKEGTSLGRSDSVNVGRVILSLRRFPDTLLIEVFDTDPHPPVLTDADEDSESGRGLMLVHALSKEWSYFLPPEGGKVVYCVIDA
jgi:anti-sigma regulatory factor (Ser/Thr protein kinase)